MGALSVVRAMRTETVERVEGELAKLNAHAADLNAEIDRLALVEDDAETADQVGAAVSATRAARNRLRKLELRIADALARLAEAKAAARAKLLAQLLAAFVPAARDFLDKARAASAATGQLIAAREALQSAGFSAEYGRLPIPPAINGSALLAEDLLDLFEKALSPAPRLVAASAPQPISGAAAPPAEPNAYARGPVMLGVSDRSPPVEHRPPHRETAAEGERLFMVHRGVLDHPRKGQLRAGDAVSMTLEEATPLIRNGAGDFITPEEVTRLDASNAVAGRLPEGEIAP